MIELDHYIERARTDWENIGVAVTIVKGDEVIYARGFGAREWGKPDEVDSDTLFQIGSTSKAMTTAALGMLVDDGKLRWDDPIVDHLAAFQVQDPWLTRHVTIRDAITHRSGILGPPYFVLGTMDSNAVVRQLRNATPKAAFRDSFLYSNLMYAVAGKVVEAASGMSWADFLKRRLFDPLNMKRSAASPYDVWDAKYVTATFLGSAVLPAGIHDAGDANVAMPHDFGERDVATVLSWQSYDNAAAAGSVVSSAADMANWLILHLNAGRFDNQELLKPQTLAELHAPQNTRMDVNDFPFGDGGESYAMGWRRRTYQGRNHLAHGGGILGFPAYIAMLPEEKVGIAVLSNGAKFVRGDRMSFHKAIMLWAFDRLLEAPLRDWRGEFLSQARRVQREGQLEEGELSRSRHCGASPSLPLEEYAGAYEDGPGCSGPVQVRAEKERLILSFAGEGAFSACLEHWHHDVFRMRVTPVLEDVLVLGGPKWQFVAFALDLRGRVTSMAAFDATFLRLSSPADCCN